MNKANSYPCFVWYSLVILIIASFLLSNSTPTPPLHSLSRYIPKDGSLLKNSGASCRDHMFHILMGIYPPQVSSLKQKFCLNQPSQCSERCLIYNKHSRKIHWNKISYLMWKYSVNFEIKTSISVLRITEGACQSTHSVTHTIPSY